MICNLFWPVCFESGVIHLKWFLPKNQFKTELMHSLDLYLHIYFNVFQLLTGATLIYREMTEFYSLVLPYYAVTPAVL